KAGTLLHDTPRVGNQLLQKIFGHAHARPSERKSVPPILVFGRTGDWRDVRFMGLAVPGVEGMSSTEDLVAIWKVSEGHRFQNYRAKFTIIDESRLSRQWLRDIANGEPY